MRWKAGLVTVMQIVVFILLSQGMDLIAHAFNLPVPGSVLGIILVFLLLQTGLLRVSWVDMGAKWLLAEMLLFFIPSAVSLVQYGSLLLHNGLRILLVIVCGTAVVMMSAGTVAQKLAGKQERRGPQ